MFPTLGHPLAAPESARRKVMSMSKPFAALTANSPFLLYGVVLPKSFDEHSDLTQIQSAWIEWYLSRSKVIVRGSVTDGFFLGCNAFKDCHDDYASRFERHVRHVTDQNQAFQIWNDVWASALRLIESEGTHRSFSRFTAHVLRWQVWSADADFLTALGSDPIL